MRRASRNVAVFSENGNIALSFGFDFCAEHEWGTDTLNRIFGVSNDPDDTTVQRYAVTAVPDEALHLVETTATTPRWMTETRKVAKHRRLNLLGGDEQPYKQTVEAFIGGYRDSHPLPDRPEALWDKGSFLFSVPVDHKHAEAVRKIHTAMMEGNALLYRTSGGPFGGAGLVIARRSTIPRNIIAGMEAELSDAKRLSL